MMHAPHIVAAIQFEPVPRDVVANMAIASQLAFEAAAKGARVVVLPELCMSGHALANVREAADCAQAQGGHQTECLAPIAVRFGCHIVHGYVEAFNGRLYNSAALIGPLGTVIGNSRKRNLWGGDHLWASPADSVMPIVPTQVGRIGALIGRDGANVMRSSAPFPRPGVPLYTPGSLDVLCLLTCKDIDNGYPDAEWVDLAESTKTNVIVSNAQGPRRGGSCVIDRMLRTWTHGTSFEDAAVVGGVVLL